MPLSVYIATTIIYPEKKKNCELQHRGAHNSSLFDMHVCHLTR